MAKPDDRRDNPERIQRNLSQTIHNMELADELIGRTDDENLRRELKNKNERRRNALEAMKDELRDESEYRKKQ